MNPLKKSGKRPGFAEHLCWNDRFRPRSARPLSPALHGARAGTAVILLRFEGCNLSCDFCDTDFEGTNGAGGGVFKTPAHLADRIQSKWRSEHPINILCTGGEPLLQLDTPLITEFHKRGFIILVETNGTQPVPREIDWICVSPKTVELNQKSGNEIKIIYPQKQTDPNDFKDLEFDHFWIQPKFDNNYKDNLKEAVNYCLNNPQWRLSIQTHRFIGIP